MSEVREVCDVSGSTSANSNSERMSVCGSGECSTEGILGVNESAISLVFYVFSFCAALCNIEAVKKAAEYKREASCVLLVVRKKLCCVCR